MFSTKLLTYCTFKWNLDIILKMGAHLNDSWDLNKGWMNKQEDNTQILLSKDTSVISESRSQLIQKPTLNKKNQLIL